MARKISVRIGEEGIEVGTLWFDAQGTHRQSSSFAYAQSWLEHPRGFALSPAMPFSQPRFFATRSGRNPAFPLPIADTCPDSWGQRVIRRYLNASGTSSPITDLDFLVNVDDSTRIGALRFFDPDQGTYLRDYDQQQGRIPPLLRLADLAAAARAIENGHETSDELALLRRAAGSLGGARPKSSVLDEERGELLIAKFTGAREDADHPIERAEAMALLLARRVGLTASKVRIMDLSPNEPVALLTRFDRTPDGKRLMFISAQSFLDAEEAESDDNTYTTIADAIRENGQSPSKMNRELFERVAYSILISNDDDHLKNHGFLGGTNGRWLLSPMFDVNPNPHRSGELYLKTAISEVSGPVGDLDALMDVAPYFGLDKDEAAGRIHHMAEQITAQWRGIARSVGMTEQQARNYRPAFEHDQSTRALALDRASEPGHSFDPEDDDEPNDPSPGM